MIHECAYVRTHTHANTHTLVTTHAHRLTSMPSGAVGGPKCLRDENSSGSKHRIKGSAIVSDISTPNDGVDYWKRESESPSQKWAYSKECTLGKPPRSAQGSTRSLDRKEKRPFCSIVESCFDKTPEADQKPRALQPPPPGLGSLTDQEVRGDIVSKHFPRRGCLVIPFKILSLSVPFSHSRQNGSLPIP